MTERVNPIRITMPDGKTVYELEFSRETAIWTNNHGFMRDQLTNNPEEMIPILFFGAFRMHHKNVARNKTDEILYEILGGLSKKILNRLLELYNAPFNTLVKDDDEEEEYEKNCQATVEL